MIFPASEQVFVPRRCTREEGQSLMDGPDSAVVSDDQLTRIEERLDQIEEKLQHLLAALGDELVEG